jgi:hypothetical protein
MHAHREALLKVKRTLEECTGTLARCGAPASIAADIQLALGRLESHIDMLDKWDGGSAWDKAPS